MNARFGMRRKTALGVTALVAITASALPAVASVAPDAPRPGQDYWGVVSRNEIGSPDVGLRRGPFATVGLDNTISKPPYGDGSLGIQVADASTSLSPASEKAFFGDEVDFVGQNFLDVDQIGFHVFQTAFNVENGGVRNMPNISIEINPHLTGHPTDTFATVVWDPDGVVPNRWSPYLDATTTGTWRITGDTGDVTGCNQTTECTFAQLKTALNDGGDKPTIDTVGVSKGRDYLWSGAVDGLRVNRTIYDFEPNGVTARRAGR
ncbi:hypothetical protein ACFV06_27055 [Streptomyces sp. NPDC059618]|uniref:hypothetical protein n=1 Tax=unclassified Streptomyces TaxID=2593676 RepID=UPI003664E28B